MINAIDCTANDMKKMANTSSEIAKDNALNKFENVIESIEKRISFNIRDRAENGKFKTCIIIDMYSNEFDIEKRDNSEVIITNEKFLSISKLEKEVVLETIVSHLNLQGFNISKSSVYCSTDIDKIKGRHHLYIKWGNED